MIAGVFDEFLGVPTHPLAVHAPVVLIPLLAIVAVVASTRSEWRRRSVLPFAGLSVVMVALLFVAKESGEAAVDANNVFGNIDRHQDLGNQTFLFGVMWLVLAVAAGVVSVVSNRSAEPMSLSAGAVTADRRQVVTAIWLLSTVALVVTTVWLIRTGHAGAESRWKL